MTSGTRRELGHQMANIHNRGEDESGGLLQEDQAAINIIYLYYQFFNLRPIQCCFFPVGLLSPGVGS